MADSGVPSSIQPVHPTLGPAALNGVAVPQAAAAPARSTSTSHPVHQDGAREILETVVFVVVLVLLLKTFVAEAFVIPTGSMAETLWGYQKIVDCPKCRYRYPVNCSREVDPPRGTTSSPITSAACPNCTHRVEFSKDGYNPPYSSGDRVLVAKFLYDLLGRSPERQDVVVFKYPKEPQEGTVAKNYIKRLIGLPGETIAIHHGDLYRAELQYPEDRPQPSRELDLWKSDYTYADNPLALEAFQSGKFQIIRKSPKVMLAERRIVHDNDFQNPDHPGRWKPRLANSGWTGDNANHPRIFTGTGSPDGTISWLRYQHLPGAEARPQLITDVMGYNSAEYSSGLYWVGDLMMECEVTVEEAAGELVLELSKGVDRFRARFDLAANVCMLERETNGNVVPLPGKKEVKLKPGSKHQIRFANFDQRLTLWVNGSLPFDEGFTYEAAEHKGPTANDLEPASIGVQGSKVTVAHLRLWRDTYYTKNWDSSASLHHADLTDPEKWTALGNAPVGTLYVQPGHYLCLGDNSQHSSDGREWGLVPRRLLIGRALAVYYPFYFPFPPLDAHANRLGVIK